MDTFVCQSWLDSWSSYEYMEGKDNTAWSQAGRLLEIKIWVSRDHTVFGGLDIFLFTTNFFSFVRLDPFVKWLKSFSKTFTTCASRALVSDKTRKWIQIALRQVSGFMGTTSIVPLARRLLRNKQCRHSASQESFQKTFEPLLKSSNLSFSGQKKRNL